MTLGYENKHSSRMHRVSSITSGHGEMKVLMRSITSGECKVNRRVDCKENL